MQATRFCLPRYVFGSTSADKRGYERGSSRMSRQKILLYIYAALAIIMMAVIFWFSAQVGSASSSKSDAIAGTICGNLIPGFEDLSLEAQAALFSTVTFGVRKTAHMSEYSVLGALYCLTVYQLGIVCNFCVRGLGLKGLAAWALAVAYAATDEVHQLFVDGRSGMASDVVIDSVGAAIGIALVILALLRQERNRGSDLAK